MSEPRAPMPPRTPVEQFAGVAAMELDMLTALIGVLDDERQALTRGDAEVLPTLIASKTDYIQALSRCAAERNHLLDAAGVTGDAAGIRGFLSPNAHAIQIWERLLSAARKASGLNTANAFLTSTRLTSVSRALAALAGPQPGLYDPRGTSARPFAPSRTLSRG